MGRKSRRRHGNKASIRWCLSICAIVVMMAVGMSFARYMEGRMNVKIENAGKQMTNHSNDGDAAQVYMNGQWYRRKNVETLLVIGIDDTGSITTSDSYNNANQADFLALMIRDEETGENRAIHLNRDTMTDITMLGVTGKAVGVEHAQLALAYNYGSGQHDSSRNTLSAVSNLLYGMDIDNYITVTMDAVTVMNDWAGGVMVEIADDMTSVDSALVAGEEVKLTGEQALAYVRARKGLDDSTNINRMERQRQYAAAWMEQAQDKLNDPEAVSELMVQIEDYYYSNCTAEELAEIAGWMSGESFVEFCELPGKSVQGEQYIEYYADDEEIQQIVLDMFYMPVEN